MPSPRRKQVSVSTGAEAILMVLEVVYQRLEQLAALHEVLEADTGKSWRWPGQLWHACGFAAQILYGVFGISYDEQGMRFNPCVPEIFKEIEIQNLNYQSAKLTVKISGTGTVECVILDDEKVDFIPYSLTGNHIVHIKLTETESECI